MDGIAFSDDMSGTGEYAEMACEQIDMLTPAELRFMVARMSCYSRSAFQQALADLPVPA